MGGLSTDSTEMKALDQHVPIVNSTSCVESDAIAKNSIITQALVHNPLPSVESPGLLILRRRKKKVVVEPPARNNSATTTTKQSASGQGCNDKLSVTSTPTGVPVDCLKNLQLMIRDSFNTCNDRLSKLEHSMGMIMDSLKSL